MGKSYSELSTYTDFCKETSSSLPAVYFTQLCIAGQACIYLFYTLIYNQMSLICVTLEHA